MESNRGRAEEPESTRSGEDTEYLTARLETRTRFEIRTQVFIPAAVTVLIFLALGALYPNQSATVFMALQDLIFDGARWFYLLAVSIFLVFVIWLAFSRHGNKRLGPDDARPDYSYLSWFAMLFSAGMGIGLVFFSVAEPISHFGITVPPWSGAPPGTPGAAQSAMTATFFHWGLHAWAIYIVIGLALCYFAYRRGLPLAMRSAFYPLLKDWIYRWPGDVIDVLAIVGTLFGVATSLGIGATQISAGINFLTAFEGGLTLQLGLILGITLVATGSVVLGLTKGIRRLSLLNVGLGGALLLFVLVTGPILFILNGLVQTIGDYMVNLVDLSLYSGQFAQGKWQAEWTLFYWGWWVSWSPFVGMFIARISRGRTIREFIVGVLLAPTAVTFLLLSVFGETALHSELMGPGGITQEASESLETALFALLDQLPLATVTSVLAIVIIATFFITSSDSGSLVDDIHASGGNVEPHAATRVFWALMEGAVAALLLALGGETGLEALQQAAVATGIPLAILLLAACWALVRAFKEEEAEPSVVLGSSNERGKAPVAEISSE